MDLLPAFQETVFRDWGLPAIPIVEACVGQPLKRARLHSDMHDIPVLVRNPKEAYWNAGSRRIWVQTDNQMLEQVCAGLARLDHPWMRPLFVRIGRHLHLLLTLGCLPRQNTTPFIEWDKREFNTAADHAANVALDVRRDWEWQDQGLIATARMQGTCLRVCVDGARRGDAQSAGGMAVYAYQLPNQGRLLFRAGKYFGHLDSSFLAEAMSMEWALEVLITTLLGERAPLR